MRSRSETGDGPGPHAETSHTSNPQAHHKPPHCDGAAPTPPNRTPPLVFRIPRFQLLSRTAMRPVSDQTHSEGGGGVLFASYLGPVAGVVGDGCWLSDCGGCGGWLNALVVCRIWPAERVAIRRDHFGKGVQISGISDYEPARSQMWLEVTSPMLSMCHPQITYTTSTSHHHDPQRIVFPTAA